jgi:hypothetical protein
MEEDEAQSWRRSLPHDLPQTMPRQVVIDRQVIFDFLWNEADGSPHFDEGQALFPQVEHTLEADMEILCDPLTRP